MYLDGEQLPAQSKVALLAQNLVHQILRQSLPDLNKFAEVLAANLHSII